LKPEHVALARKVAQQSIVLLKNESGILPLGKLAGTIAVIGPLADDKSDPLGPWSAVGRPEDVVTVLEGMKQAASPQTKILYAKGCEITGDSSDFATAMRFARKSDVVVAVLGEEREMSGEASSRSNLNLPGKQSDLLAALRGTGKPIVLVLMNGRPLILTSVSENADAIVEAWFLGTESGHAIADILFGAVSPSGKLPVSFPRSVGQIPVYYNHKSTGRPIADSDRFTSRYLDVPNTPLYAFGYGLSYASFKYDNLRLSSASIAKNQNIRVTIDVENTGKRTADEIVQLYVQDEVASIARPVEELKGFRRITLRPGEKQSVGFTLTTDDLSFYGQSMQKIVEPGEFKVFVGGNSVDLLETRFVLQ
jgi:beta-glucosidase